MSTLQIQVLANGTYFVPSWEVLFYAVVITAYAFLGRPRSCLINTFAFSLYWGFKHLLPLTSSQAPLLIYAVSGIAVYLIVTLSFLEMRRQNYCHSF
jgi:hypothetical protein